MGWPNPARMNARSSPSPWATPECCRPTRTRRPRPPPSLSPRATGPTGPGSEGPLIGPGRGPRLGYPRRYHPPVGSDHGHGDRMGVLLLLLLADQPGLVAGTGPVRPQFVATRGALGIARLAQRRRTTDALPPASRCAWICHDLASGARNRRDEKAQRFVLRFATIDASVIPACHQVQAWDHHHRPWPAVPQGAIRIGRGVGPVPPAVAVSSVRPPQPAVTAQVVTLVIGYRARAHGALPGKHRCRVAGRPWEVAG